MHVKFYGTAKNVSGSLEYFCHRSGLNYHVDKDGELDDFTITNFSDCCTIMSFIKDSIILYSANEGARIDICAADFERMTVL